MDGAGVACGTPRAELTRLAPGTLADDEEVGDVVRPAMEPTFFGALRAGRRTTDESARLISRVLGARLEAKGANQRPPAP